MPTGATIDRARASQPLLDFVESTRFQILEDDKQPDDTGRMKIRGRFSMFGVKNGNGRIYPEALWDKTLADPEVRGMLEARLMLGEIEHPADGNTHLARAAVVVTGLFKQGQDIIGEAEVLSTPNGKVLKALIRDGIPLGISSRGRGTSVWRGDAEYVNESDYRLETFDVVYRPSTPAAYAKLVAESLTGPYLTESPMDTKLAEVRRIALAAHRTAESAKTAAPETFPRMIESLVADEANLTTLRGQLKEERAISEATEAGVEVRRALATVRKMHLTRLEETQSAHASDVRKTLSEARSNGAAASGPTVPLAKYEAAVRRGSQYRKQAVALARGTAPAAKLEAAVKIAETLSGQKLKLENEVAQLRGAYAKLHGRYVGNVRAMAEMLERSDRARIVRAATEAVSDNPALKPFLPLFREADSLPALKRLVKFQSEALAASKMEGEDAPVAPPTDAPVDDAPPADGEQIETKCPTCGYVEMTASGGGTCPECGATMAPASEGSGGDAPADAGGPPAAAESVTHGDPALRFESQLPGPGGAGTGPTRNFFERADAANHPGGRQERLNERTGDRVADTANRVVNSRPGWR